MNKTWSAIFLVIALALAALSYHQAEIIRVQQRQLAALESDASAAKERIASASFERQQRCSEQASKTFARMGFGACQEFRVRGIA